MEVRNPLLTTLAVGLVFCAAMAIPSTAVATPRAASATTHRVLFDDTKAETAGNADWIISTGIPDPTVQNPSPATEKDWTGAISSWGVALQKTGQYSLKTLGAGNPITYGNTTNPLDLSNFDTFVLPEPNILLSAAEKTAVMQFVRGGGGLFLISDHTGSDRNNDGKDSPTIINDLLTNNGVDNSDPFGFSVDLKNITSDHPVAITDAADPVLNGPFGTVRHSLIANGTTFTLKPADNPSVKGLLYLSTATPGNTNAFFVTSTFGSGRVAVWGDSSTIDDGTGQPGNTLFNGWSDPTADNAALGLNATAWLASGPAGTPGAVTVTGPGNQATTAGTAVALQIRATDNAGGTLSYSATGLPTGLAINRTTGLISGTPTTPGSSTVTVTATDSTGPVGTTSFTWQIGSTGGSCPPAQVLGNPGFETGTAAPWTASAKVLANSTKEPARTGAWDAWLDGYGTSTTNTLTQTVTLPSGCSAYPLSFWLHIDTAETSTAANDTLKVEVLNGSGTVLSTVATFSNTNAASGYIQHTYDLAAYAGQTVTLRFTGVEGNSKQTSFVLDDTALAVS